MISVSAQEKINENRFSAYFIIRPDYSCVFHDGQDIVHVERNELMPGTPARYALPKVARRLPFKEHERPLLLIPDIYSCYAESLKHLPKCVTIEPYTP